MRTTMKKSVSGRKKRAIPPGFVSIPGTMARLNLSRTTVVDLMRANRLTGVKLWGVWYIRDADVDAEIERRERSNKIIRKERPRNVAKALPKRSAISAAHSRPQMSSLDEGAISAKAVPLLRSGLGERDLVERLAIPFDVAERLSSAYRKADRDRELVIDEKRLSELRELIGWFDGPPTISSFFLAINAWKKRADDAIWAAVDEVRQLGWHALTDTSLPGPPRIALSVTGASRLSIWSLDSDGEETCRTIDISSLVKPTEAEVAYAKRKSAVEDDES